MEKLHDVKNNFVFIKLCLAISGLYFVVTGIQYWAPHYLNHVLEMEAGEATATFIFVTFTAPISGVILGGIITTYLGGYNSRKSHIMQGVMGICALIFSLPTPFFGPES